MSNKLTDYDNKKVTNLNDFYPSNLKNKFIDNLNSTVFNRFLTKKDYERVIGGIGTDDLTSAIRNILERSEYLQNNQLQPVLTAALGAEKIHMSWADFLRILEKQGVDVDSYAEWGKVTQFNWVPPIDLDKFVNFRDYFWDTSLNNSNPDYITVENRTLSRELKQVQFLRTALEALRDGYIVQSTDVGSDTLNLSGNLEAVFLDGSDVVIKYESGKYAYNKINSVGYDNLQSATVIGFEKDVTEAATSIAPLWLKYTVDSLDNSIITVSGDLTKFVGSGFVLSAFDDINVEQTFIKVASSSYDEDADLTTISLEQNIPYLNGNISLAPLVLVSINEPLYDTGLSALQLTGSELPYQLIWLSKFNKIASSSGETYISQLKLTDATVDFLASGVEFADTLEIELPSGATIICDINAVAANQVDFVTDESSYIFSIAGVSYKIYESKSIDDYRTEPPLPSSGDVFVDGNDIKIFDGSTWNIVAYNINFLEEFTVTAKNLAEKNDWSNSNAWVHKTQVQSLSGKIRAQLPIIEFWGNLSLSSMTKVDYDWSYSPTPTSGYRSIDVEPPLFELLNVQYKTAGSPAFQYDPLDNTKLYFNPRYGNLTESILANPTIKLSGFQFNDGVYNVIDAQFTQQFSGYDKVTVITLDRPLNSTVDYVDGATISPKQTIYGDEYVSPYIHWRYDGVNNVRPTSERPEKRDVYSQILGTENYPGIESKYGVNWQSYVMAGGDQIDPILPLQTSLRQYCLCDDYQEGDLRVYVNKVRQYGNFIELPSDYGDERFIGAIQFVGGVTLTPNDVVVIEVGEYTDSDVGRRAVLVKTVEEDRYELANLSIYKRHEQRKTDANQQPYFVVYDAVTKKEHITASKLFSYEEDASQSINQFIGKKLAVANNTATPYVFRQHLSDGERLLAYEYSSERGKEISTIWKVGVNFEKYQPELGDDGQWKIPNNFYYNAHHENRDIVTYLDVFTHFRSIIQAQTQPGLALDAPNSYYGDMVVNYGLGGTIKEHNGNMDILLSAIFDRSNTVQDVISFAEQQYDNSLFKIRNIFTDNINELFKLDATSIENLSETISEEVINKFESDSKYSYWFGDTSMYANGLGIKNWILTLPMMGIVQPTRPYVVSDDKMFILEVVHHDGHRSSIYLTPAEREQLYNTILENSVYVEETVADDLQAFPTTINDEFEGVVRAVRAGDYVKRTNINTLTRLLYRFNGSTWDRVNITEMLAKTILTVEERLYEVCKYVNTESRYDLQTVESFSKYQEKLREQFDIFSAESGIETPLSNSQRYDDNNAFTWNYYFTSPSTLPTAQPYVAAADWREVYKRNLGTPYPHLEPWVLQGFAEKPTWWDAEYLVGNTFSELMWDNIFAGIVPVGYALPNGDASTGVPAEVATYTYLPVVSKNITTPDGYTFGNILPPYWNSVNNLGESRIRSYFDPDSGDDIVTPNLDFNFGEGGDFEHSWERSLSYNYDRMIVAFKLDPLNFMSDTFGYEKVNVGCLEIHKYSGNITPGNRVNLHGDEYNSEVLNVVGLNQWYVNHNRYKGFDASNSTFRAVWNSSEMKLAYTFDSIIDTESFGIRSELIDLTDKDYSVELKKTEGAESRFIDAPVFSLISIPSRFMGDTDRGWTMELSTLGQRKRGIFSYGVQNYEVTISGNNFVVGSDNIFDVDYTQQRERIVIEYNSTLKLSTPTGLDPLTQYTVDVNGSTLTIDGSEAQTISALLDALNAQVSGGFFDLEIGNIILNADSPLSSVSIASDSLFLLIPGYVAALPAEIVEDKFNNAFLLRGNKTIKYTKGTQIQVSDTALFDGQYTVTSSSYDFVTDVTTVNVLETVDISGLVGSLIIEGRISLVDELGLPEDWQTGEVVYFNTYDNLSGLSQEAPYYIIRINDTTFQIAKNQGSALNGMPISLTSVSHDGALYAGRIERTFKALGGARTSINWRIHKIDNRVVKRPFDGASITGLQNVVDFLVGYYRYAQDLGFDVSFDNRDNDTNRILGWEMGIEKLIDWAFEQRTSRQTSRLEYKVEFDPVTDAITITDSNLPNWGNGTAVTFTTQIGASLPSPFADSNTVQIPYYIVRTSSNNSFKLASNPYNANTGNYIKFNTPSTGTIVLQIYERFDARPAFIYSPFIKELLVNHDVGLLSNVFERGNYVYGIDGNNLSNSQLIVTRDDVRSSIALLGKVSEANANGTASTYICGAEIAIDTYEHILCFSDYTVSGSLIYDQFLGLRTPRFLVDIIRQSNRTLRPTMGGYVLNGTKIVPNLESAVDDSRYFYDDIKAEENKDTTKLVRDLLGYDGPKDYMTDIGINDKSQFIFWKSMIQNKGTNLAVNAFTGQTGLENALVDEFWAYKVADFGGAGQFEYPEMKLFASDSFKTELRLEFVPPNNSVLNTTFIPVALTDKSRWWNQPDQFETMAPYDTFYFQTKVAFSQQLSPEDIVTIRGKKYFILPSPCDAAIITYNDGTQIQTLTEQSDYSFTNAKLIKFDIASPELLNELTVVGLTYNSEAESPCKFIDKKSGTVVDTIPFWNPALGQYDTVYTAPVDVMSASDPAIYSYRPDGIPDSNNYWLGDKVGTIWVDNKNEGYVPYYDKAILPNIDDRIANWGKAADWSDIEVYQWTRTTLTPEEWDQQSIAQTNNYAIEESQRVTGLSKKSVYKNIAPEYADPVWELDEDVHVEAMAGLMDTNGLDALFGTVEVYINGRFVYTRTISSIEEIQFIEDSQPVGTYLHFIRRAHVPTKAEIDSLQYKYDTAYSWQYEINPENGQRQVVYYYWVSGKYNKIYSQQREYTLAGIKTGLQSRQTPYMIVQGARAPGAGYGLVYGNIFDEFGYELPYRYTQLVVKGLEGKIRDNDRYTLRFTKDYNLRDRLPQSSLKLKNVHEEWKLFREKQLNKIDSYLWNKLVSAVATYETDEFANVNMSVQVPSLDRTVYDQIYGTSTRIGLGAGRTLVDSDIAKDTISTVITEIADGLIESERELLQAIDFSTPQLAARTLWDVYNSASVSTVNAIFMRVLHDALSQRIEYSDILKTSWVAIQISQDVVIPEQETETYSENLVSGAACLPEPVIPVTPKPTVPQPTPTPEPTPTVTPTGTAAVTPTPTPTVTASITPTPTSSAIAPVPTPTVTASGTPAVTQTPTVTPTVTPSVTPSGTPEVTPAPTPSPVAGNTIISETGDTIISEDNQVIIAES